MNLFPSYQGIRRSPVLLLLLGAFAACSDAVRANPGDAAAVASTDPVYDELFDDAVPHEFIIEISQAEWEGITQDMLDYAAKFPVTPLYPGDGREYRTDKYRKADFIYRRPDGTEVKLEQVGIHTRGNESRRLPYQNGQFYKSHFKVKFDETFDLAKSDPNYATIDQRRFAGLHRQDQERSWPTEARPRRIRAGVTRLCPAKASQNCYMTSTVFGPKIPGLGSAYVKQGYCPGWSDLGSAARQLL